MRRDIREGVKKHMIDGIKPNYTALAEQYGCDYRTLKQRMKKRYKVINLKQGGHIRVN